MKTFRVGIIGTGLAVERLHLPGLAKLRDRFSLVVCAGRDQEKARALVERSGISEVAADAESILHRKDIDVVLLSLPIELNAEWALKALAAGKPALSEKPVAATRSEAETLCRAAAKPGAPALMVGENFLFWPHMAEAIRMVRDGTLGHPRMAVVHQVQDARKAGEWLTDWRVAPKFEGGFVLDGGVHWAAVLNAMFGEVTEVITRTSAFEESLPPMDTGAALISYRSGARVLWATAYSAAPSGEALVTVHGSEGSVAIFWDHTDWRDAKGELHKITSPMDSYEAEWRHFHDVLRGTKPLAYTPEQGLKDLDLILKICGK